MNAADPRTVAFIAFVALTACWLGSCAPPAGSDKQPSSGTPATSRSNFSPREVAAARKLSLADEATVSSGDAFAKALRCRDAIGRLANRLRRTDAATSEQIAQIEAARDHFERSAREALAGRGAETATLRKKLARPASSGDVVADARVAMACVRSGASRT